MNKNLIYVIIVTLVLSVVAFGVAINKLSVSSITDSDIEKIVKRTFTDLGSSFFTAGTTTYDTLSLNDRLALLRGGTTTLYASATTTLNEVVLGGSCAASTTLFSVKEPFNSTSTLDWVNIEVTRPATTTYRFSVATSSFDFSQGTSTMQWRAVTNTYPNIPMGLSYNASIISTNDIGTGTMAYVTNGALLGSHFGVTGSSPSVDGSNTPISAFSTSSKAIFGSIPNERIQIAPNTYIVGFAWHPAVQAYANLFPQVENAATSTAASLRCVYKMRFLQ